MGKKVIILLLAPLWIGWHWFEPAARRNQRGIWEFSKQRYADALKTFLSAKGLRPEAAELKSNTAAALYQLQKYREALAEWSAIQATRPISGQGDLFYDMGNTHFRLQQYDRALECYKQCLLRRPGDIAAKKNLEITLKKLAEPNKQNQESSPDQARQQPQRQDYQPMLRFLNQNEMEQLKRKKHSVAAAGRERDW